MKSTKAVTLIETLMGVVILAIIVLGFTGIDFFARTRLISGTRRTVANNQASLLLEGMQKQLLGVVGNVPINTMNGIVRVAAIGGNPAIRMYVDDNNNGVSDVNDRWCAYRLNANTIQFCQECTNANCNNNCPLGGGWESISDPRIQSFIPGIIANSNRVTLEVTACWDLTAGPPANVANGGTRQNPCVTMRTAVAMPMVSAN